jgi:multidrug transporter EmrE-like cation transporter
MIQLSARWIIVLSIIFITIFEAMAQSCLKSYRNNNNYLYLGVAILFYTVVCFLLINCYRNDGYLGEVNLMWSCMSIIIILIFGHVMFDEELTKNEVVAILLALGAIYFANQE